MLFRSKKQEVIIHPEHRDQKDGRLDILVEDINGNLYNIEMQRSDDDDIASRMRYYASKNDQRYTLHQGYTYNDLKNVFIIFFFNDTATTEIYTLSLHDALPIYLLAFKHSSFKVHNSIPPFWIGIH